MILLLWYVYILFLPCPVVTHGYCQVETNQRIITAMQYHGIRSAQKPTPTSKWIFYRDNQKCTLFTQAFNNWYNNQTGAEQ